MSDQYRIISDGAGWLDRAGRGRVRFRGSDAASFLQALVSNEVASLQPGQGVYATYLTPQGRMIADLRIYRRGDSFVADVAPSTGAALAERFDQLIFAEDVQSSDATAELSQTTVIGGRAAEIVGEALGMDAAALRALPVWAQLDARDAGGDGVFVVRTDDATLPSFDVFGPAGAAASIRERLAGAGAGELPRELAESLRIDAGRPRFGVDMTEQTIPLEAGLLDRAIGTGKGCYVGQEVIIRVLHRGGGRVAKRLVRLAFDPGVVEPPAAGDAIEAGGKPTGTITSVARAPDDSRWIALGYTHRDVAEEGRQVTIAGRPDAGATIAGLAG